MQLLHFQPFFDARQRCPVGVEALLRWQHPTRGLVSPAAFIPIAEETGHIVELGAWVLDSALAQLRHWQSTYPAAHGFSMAVNLSTHQLASNGLVEMIEHALKRHQVPPSTLWLELTESSVMNEVERARQTLDRLRGLGVLLAIDDFGTGYSSLAYLRDLPVNLLKLDRGLCRVDAHEQARSTHRCRGNHLGPRARLEDDRRRCRDLLPAEAAGGTGLRAGARLSSDEAGNS